MTSTATIAADFKNAFWSTIRDLLAASPDTADVYVSFGHPGTLEPDDIVTFGQVSEQQDAATLSTNRTRNEIILQTITISVARAGGPEMEQICSDRAYSLLRTIEQQVRVTDTTVGGTVWFCLLQSHNSQGETDMTLLERGRIIEITAIFQAHARITT